MLLEPGLSWSMIRAPVIHFALMRIAELAPRAPGPDECGLDDKPERPAGCRFALKADAVRSVRAAAPARAVPPSWSFLRHSKRGAQPSVIKVVAAMTAIVENDGHE
jgi:hypothetical protein